MGTATRGSALSLPALSTQGNLRAPPQDAKDVQSINLVLDICTMVACGGPKEPHGCVAQITMVVCKVAAVLFFQASRRRLGGPLKDPSALPKTPKPLVVLPLTGCVWCGCPSDGGWAISPQRPNLQGSSVTPTLSQAGS